MKFKDLFKNPVKKEISELTNSILNEQWQKEVSEAKIESAGIADFLARIISSLSLGS